LPDSWRRLSFRQRRLKLDCGQFRIDNHLPYKCPVAFRFCLWHESLCGTDGGGIFLSTNDGASWAEVNNGLTNHNVFSLAFYGTNLFAGTLGGGVFYCDYTSSANPIWTTVNNNNGLPPNTYVYALVVSGTNLFAGLMAAAFFVTTSIASQAQVGRRSFPAWAMMSTLLPSPSLARTLCGDYWRRFLLRLQHEHNLDCGQFRLVELLCQCSCRLTQRAGGTNLFAGTDGGGVFLSDNDGASWTEVNNGLTNTVVYSLAVSPTGQAERISLPD